MYNLYITRYYNTKSIIHSMNSFYKIICILLFTFLVLLSKSILFLIILFLSVLILMVLSNVPMKLYFKNLKFGISLITFIFLINLIFDVPIRDTIISVLKLLLFILYSGVMVYTTKPNDLIDGLTRLLKPLQIFNVNVPVLALTISLAIRFIPIIFEQSSKVLKSQYSRGLDLSGTLKERCDKLVSIFIPIFNLVFKRSDQISDVLELRLYRVNEKRTVYKEEEYGKFDQLIIVLHTTLFLIYLIMEVKI